MAEKDRIRTRQIRIKVTEEELKYISDKAAYCNKTITSYARQQILDGHIINLPVLDIKKLLIEINKIGVNINQIAHRVNLTDNFYKEDFKEIQNKYNELLQIITSEVLKTEGWLSGD